MQKNPETGLPQALLDELATRRGRRHVYDDIAPKATALVVVDMQNFFVAHDGYSYVPDAAGVVPAINRLAQVVRATGGQVVWVRTTLAAKGRQAWDLYFRNFTPDGQSEQRRLALTPGHQLHEFWPELDLQSQDLIVDKDRFSAFIEGASDLEHELRARELDTLLVTGTLTNVCCESTARDAMMRDFKTVMISDANAARSLEDHLAGLRTFVQVFGDVRSTEEIIALLEAT